jgi:hypothetical protein
MIRHRLKPTTFEQRSVLYQDILSLISPGFLSYQETIGDIVFSFRTLYPSDMETLRLRTQDQPLEVWKTWVVATSLFMINGSFLLEDVPKNSEIVYGFLESFPSPLVNRFYYICLSLFRRLQEAIEGVNLYSLEDSSRVSWKVMGSDLKNYFPYVSKLGFNTIQNIWSIYNRAEDAQDQFRNQWEGFKLVARTNAPKAIESLSSREIHVEEEQKKEKQKKLDLYFYYKLGHISKEVYESDSVYTLNKIKTLTDLQEEYQNWISGKKDEHDLAVDKVKEHVLQGVKDREKKREEYEQYLDMIEETETKEAEQFASFPKLRAYTPEQLQNILAQQKGRQVLNEDLLKARSLINTHLLSNNKS